MQVQSINNDRNPVSFGICKDIKCHRDFCKRHDRHIKLMELFKESPAFEELGKDYTYIAHFDRDFGFIDKFFKAKYKLYLTPVPKTKIQIQSITEKVRNWFCGNKK